MVAYNSNAGEGQPDSETAPSNTASCTTSAGGPGQVAADDFESYAADANLGAEANWDAVVGAFIVKDVSGVKYATGNSGAANSAVVWAGSGTFTSDQYVEFQIRWNGSTGYIAGSTRHQAGVETYYRVLAIPNSSQIRIDKYVNGVQTVGTPVSQGLATGNWVRMETTGTAAGNAVRNTVKVDTGGGYTTVINAEDPGVYMDNGKPGLSSYDNNYNASAAQWRAGNI